MRPEVRTELHALSLFSFLLSPQSLFLSPENYALVF